MNKLLYGIVLAAALTTGVLAKYDIFPDTVAVGDNVKPEDGAAFVVQSTTLGSLPCPKMTEAQRDAIAVKPTGGCVFNTTASSTQYYNGSTWLNAGSSAVLSSWLTGTTYGIGTFIYDPVTFKIYVANTPHTAGATLAADIALGYWDELSDGVVPISVSTDNAIVRFDGVTGDLIQDSGITIDDTNNISTAGDLKVGAGTSLEFDLILSLFRARMTGVAEPNGLTVDGGGTTFGINATEGQIVDFDAQTYDVVSYAGSTGNAPATANGVTYIYLDVAGAISTTTTLPTPSERREKLYLGRAITVGGTIVQVLDEPVVTENAAGSIYDLAKAIRIFNEEGNLITANGANLNLNKSAGKVFSVGANYTTDRNNPHRVDVPACTACTFAYITQTAGSTQANTTLFDPANYDVSGTITAVPGANKTATIQRLYLFPSGSIRVAYGQTTYSDLTTALQNLSTEEHVDNPAVFGNGILFALIVTRKDATDLSNSAHARILYPSRFGESAVGAAGQSVSSLQDAYNNSTDGEIVLDAVNTSVEIRDSSGAIGSPLLEVLSNDSLTSYFSVSATGTTIEDITIADSVITDNTQDTLWFQNAIGATTPASFAIASDRASANDDTALFLYGRGKAGAITNSEFLELRWNTTSSDYTIETGNTGTGTLYPLEIRAGSANANQLLLNTDGSIDVVGNLTMNGTGAIKVPEGTTGDRPTPETGMFRFNSTLSSFEGYDGSVWGEIGGGDLTEVYADTTNGLLFLNATQQGISIRDSSGGVGGSLLSVDSFDGSSNYWSVSTSGMQLGGTGAVVSTILDEDDMASDSDGVLATQQSIKAYTQSEDLRTREINYITNNDLETDAAGYAAFDDVTAYIDGTSAGAPNVTMTRNTTTPIQGTGDLKMVVGATTATYEGFSYDFTIDKGMQAQKLTGSFWYDTSDPNYVDDDIRIFIYDVTNSQIIRVNGEDLKGGKGRHYFQFQTASDSTSYRVSFMVNSANTAGFSIYFDQIAVSPTNLARGSIITDWESYTPTTQGFGTISSDTFKYKRVGDSIIINGYFVTGTNTSVEAQIGLPAGLSIDSTTVKTSVGDYYLDATTTANGGSLLATGGDTFLNLGAVAFGSGSANASNPANATSIVNNGDGITFTTKEIKIQGWSSDAVQSSDLGGREIVAEGAGNGSTLIIADTTNIDFTETRDTTSSWDGSKFVTPETGDYDIEGSIRFTTSIGDVLSLWAAPAATPTTFAVVKSVSTSIASAIKNFTGSISLNKGDVLALRAGTGGTLNNVVGNHWIHIQKLASPQTMFDDTYRIPPTIQKFTSGSGTYTKPSGVKYLKIKMVGGGGGGGGSGTASWGFGGNGGSTTFGSSLLTATGGVGGQYPGSASSGGAGGSATVASPAINLVSAIGSQGSTTTFTGSEAYCVGGVGGTSPFGGGSGSGYSNGTSGQVNSGSGGSGAGGPITVVQGGNGGGSGGYIEALIDDPSDTYSYAIGAGGTSGAAGTSGSTAGSGGSGVIIIEEYYQ